MGIQHLDVSKGGYSRVTFSKNLAFFTGHAAPQYQTLKEQAEGILKRYDELFKQFGLKKSNILYTTCFMKNADDEDEFADIYFQWIDPKNPPAGVTVTALPIQHSPVGDNILMELSFIVATNDSLPIKRYDVTRGCPWWNTMAWRISPGMCIPRWIRWANRWRVYSTAMTSCSRSSV